MIRKQTRRRAALPVGAEMIQPLEGRQLMSAAHVVSPAVEVLAASSTVTGYTPAQITAGYGLTGLTYGTAAADGTGQTIALVDAYNDPDIAADLATFSTAFGLATPNLTVVSQTGSTTALPTTDADWAQEISLDVEWAHAIAPGAKLLLVEADSDSTDDLTAAVDYARTVAGVSVVSMSWGTTEFSDETSYDSYFTTPSGHTGVTFVAAAGDDGSADGAEWPAAAAGVVSVGGTTLTLSTDGTYESETGWADGGGGASVYEGEAAFQYSAQRTGYRTTPDVAWDASVDTGVAVYDSVSDDGSSGWLEFGGTSAGAPQWSALIAVADQGRAAAGLGTLDGATNTLPTLYGLYAHKSTDAADYNDITSGSTSQSVSATTGYDEVSGIGTPRAAELVAALVRSTVSVALTQTAVTVTQPPNPGPPHIGWHVAAADEGGPVVAVAADWADAPAAAAAAPAGVDLGRSAGSTAMPVAPWVVPPAIIPPPDVVPAASADGATDLGVANVDAPSAAPTVTWVRAATAATAAAVRVVPLPADFVAPGLPSAAVAVVGPTPHAAGLGAVVAGAAVALWAATEPARDRRRAAAAEPLSHRQLVAPGLLRG